MTKRAMMPRLSLELCDHLEYAQLTGETVDLLDFMVTHCVLWISIRSDLPGASARLSSNAAAPIELSAQIVREPKRDFIAWVDRTLTVASHVGFSQ